jgi:hypothetical protein
LVERLNRKDVKRIKVSYTGVIWFQ